MYDSNGNLTRVGAEQTIKDGGTVHLRGADGQVREYKRVEQLPSEAEFAIGDPTARQKALDGLKAQREQLDEQERKLLTAAKDEKAAREDAEKRDKDRAKNAGDAPPQTLHQQVGGRPLSGAENPLAEQEANERAERERKAAEAADPRRQQQPSGGRRAAADDEDKPKAHGHGHK